MRLERDWATAVKTKDGWACRDCGSRHDLHAHHVIDPSIAPERRYELANGVTLCRACRRRWQGKKNRGVQDCHEAAVAAFLWEAQLRDPARYADLALRTPLARPLADLPLSDQTPPLSQLLTRYARSRYPE